MKILFLVPYPLQVAPSQRFRFEQYFAILETAGHQIQSQTFLSKQDWKLFYQPGQAIKKLFALVKGYLKRIYALFIALKFDYIFIHREVTPLGPPVFELIIAKILRKKIIYDFDDAIWLTDRENESVFLRISKWRRKVKSICRWSYKVSCGNRYLQEYALQFNPNAIINPTTIDSEKTHKPLDFDSKRNVQHVVIGWTGSHSTLKYLEAIEPVLQKFESEFDQVSFLVIADQPPSLTLHRLKFLPWKAPSEVDDLLKMDIGIMPLPDDEWSKGKCGFKALQYMAMEIPALVSPIGVNTSIVDHGINGFYCSSNDEWIQYLSQLIRDKSLREQMGEKGREKVINQFSVASNTDNFLSLFS